MNLTENLRVIVIALAITFTAGLLFVNVYNSVVDAPNWGSNVPVSIEAARAYFKSANPGTFFRAVSPVNQIVALLALILCWKAGPELRLICGLGLVLAVVSDIFTFAYFYPRNQVMFESPLNADALKLAQSQWASMNWVRSSGVLLNLVVNFVAMFKLFGPAAIR